MKVLFSAEADADLATIRSFISLGSQRRAESFVREIVEACLAIVDVPLGWPILPRYEQAAFRRKTHRRYLIFYRVQPDHVQIVRVLHGARDLDRLLTDS